jgi:hypothetical protein
MESTPLVLCVSQEVVIERPVESFYNHFSVEEKEEREERSLVMRFCCYVT